MFNETPKSRSHVSKMGFGVVPSVSDGVLNLHSQREGTTSEQMSKMGEETNKRYVQRDSKVSESSVQNWTAVRNDFSVPLYLCGKNGSVQGHSKHSELFEKTEKHYVQRHSKVSESSVKKEVLGGLCSVITGIGVGCPK